MGKQPKNWKLLIHRVNLHIKIQDYKHALEDAFKLKNLFPNYYYSYALLASIYSDSDSPYYNINIAVKWAKQSVEISPNILTRIYYVKILSKTNDKEKILKEMKDKKGYEREHLILGTVYNKQKDFIKSIEHLNLALPKYAPVIFKHKALKEVRNMPESIKLMKKVKNLLNINSKETVPEKE